MTNDSVVNCSAVCLCGGLSLLPTFDLMRGSRFYLAFFFFFLAGDSFALVAGNNSFSSEAAGNFSVMKDLAFGMATIADNVLICTFLHLWKPLAIAQNCNRFCLFSPVGLLRASLNAWGFLSIHQHSRTYRLIMLSL